jgi:transcriptional regulator with XRE-family HTH domain
LTAPGHRGRSEGSRLLLAALQETTTRDAARVLGVSHVAVVLWCSGLRRPSYYARMAVLRVFGVDPGAWDRPPVPTGIGASELVTTVT